MSTALRLTVNEYDAMIRCGAFDQLDRRVELIRGELREMNPAGPIHDDFIAYLTRWSTTVTTASEATVRVQSGLNLPELESRPEPDILWVEPKRYLDRHPLPSEVLLGIEVSDSSLDHDRYEKAVLYAEAGMVEYWVIDITGKHIFVHSRPSRGKFVNQNEHGIDATISPARFPGAKLTISELFGPT